MKKNTIADLIEYLQTLPPKTPVNVLEEYTSGYQTTTRWVDLNLPEASSNNITYVDNQWPRHGLYIGCN